MAAGPVLEQPGRRPESPEGVSDTNAEFVLLKLGTIWKLAYHLKSLAKLFVDLKSLICYLHLQLVAGGSDPMIDNW